MKRENARRTASSPPRKSVGRDEAAQLGPARNAQSERPLRARLARFPRDPDALEALAGILVRRGRIREATALLTQALAVAPRHPTRLRLSALHQRQSHYPAALALLEQVPAELRQSPGERAREAALLGHLGRRDDEIAIYQKLLEDRPASVNLWISLGIALNYAGRTADAIDAHCKAIEIAPQCGQPWWSLADLKSYRFTDEELARMHRQLDLEPRPIDALHFHFALGRGYEERGEYERSFTHYAAGNSIRAARLKPDEMRVTAFVDQAISTFSPELFERFKGSGCESDAPIFVVGLQRSGSTLIEQILASHLAVEATAELKTMQHLWEEIGTRVGDGKSSPFEAVVQLEPAALKKIGEDYLARTRPFRRLGRRRFVDKLPANWLTIGLIRLALPNARIIDARRHPMACGFSNFKQHYSAGVSFAYSLETIGQFYRDYLRLMRHFDRVQPGAVLRVIHEHLVANPEREIRRILDYVGLPFDPACLEFHESRRAVHTPSAEQVRRPINSEGVDVWRNYERWLAPLEVALGPALDGWER